MKLIKLMKSNDNVINKNQEKGECKWAILKKIVKSSLSEDNKLRK